MKKRMKTHKSNFKTILKVFLILTLTSISFLFVFNFTFANVVNKALNNESLPSNLFNLGTNNIDLNISVLSPKMLLKIGLNNLLNYDLPKEIEDIKLINTYENPEDPILYIYNTHDKETYKSDLLETYNIKYNVKMASYLLSKYLNDLNIKAFAEDTSPTELVNTLDIYKNNYEASRVILEKRMKEYPTLKYFIDIHRDSKDADTKVTYENNPYASILFVIGIDNKDYRLNETLTKRIDSKIDKTLTRGIIKKTGQDSNGVYNQDLNSNIILIEIGSENNTIEEVDNTLKYLSKILYEIIKEDENGKEGQI